MLTAEEITWFQSSASDAHTTVTDNAFAALIADQQKDLTCCSMVRGVMNRADPTDSSAFGALYYETVTGLSNLFNVLRINIDSAADDHVFDAVHQKQKTVLIHIAQISRMQPSVNNSFFG